MWWRWWQQRQQAARSAEVVDPAACAGAGRAAAARLTLAGKWHKIHSASSSLAVLSFHIGTVSDDYTIFSAYLIFVESTE